MESALGQMLTYSDKPPQVTLCGVEPRRQHKDNLFLPKNNPTNARADTLGQGHQSFKKSKLLLLRRHYSSVSRCLGLKSSTNFNKSLLTTGNLFDRTDLV